MKPISLPRKFATPESAADITAAPPNYVESFPPSIGACCRVLILGSMPGERSLVAGQYYAHPQNQFWPMMEAVFGVPRALPYARRIATLADCGVGLWDVLQGCKRRGSLDSAIERTSEIPNAIDVLLTQREDIAAVAFNGAKAAQAFARHVEAAIPPQRRQALVLHPMPSTSPAHASMTWPDKLARWSALARYTGR